MHGIENISGHMCFLITPCLKRPRRREIELFRHSAFLAAVVLAVSCRARVSMRVIERHHLLDLHRDVDIHIQLKFRERVKRARRKKSTTQHLGRTASRILQNTDSKA